MDQQLEMNVTVNELSAVERELRIEIAWDSVRRAVEQKYGEIRKSARPMRGFRKGKAPRWLLEQQFGPIVEAEVAQQLVSEALIKAFEDSDLAPVATPKVEPEEMKRGQPLAFTARVEVRPVLGDITFKGLEVTRPVREVKDEEVNEQVERLRDDNAAVRSPLAPRPARLGDVVVVDSEVRTAGSDEPARVQKDQEVELGKGHLLQKVEDALVGMSAGEEKDVEVEFPDLSNPDSEEKRKVTFHLLLKDVREKVLPEVDDEFARDVSEHETLLELRLDIRKELEKQIAAAGDAMTRERVIDALVDANPIEVPPTLVERQSTETQRELARMLGFDLEKQPLSEDQVERISAQAERKVRAALLLGEVADREKLEVTDGDIDAKLAEIAERTGQPLPKVRAEVGKGDRIEQIRSSMLQDRVVDLLLAEATITDKDEEEAEAEEQAAEAAEESGADEAAGAADEPQDEAPEGAPAEGESDVEA